MKAHIGYGKQPKRKHGALSGHCAVCSNDENSLGMIILKTNPKANANREINKVEQLTVPSPFTIHWMGSSTRPRRGRSGNAVDILWSYFSGDKHI